MFGYLCIDNVFKPNNRIHMYDILKSETVQNVLKAFLNNNEQVVAVENLPLLIKVNLKRENKKDNENLHDHVASIYQNVKDRGDAMFAFFKQLSGMYFYSFFETKLSEMKNSSLLIEKFREELGVPQDAPEAELNTLGDYVRFINAQKKPKKAKRKKAAKAV